MYNPVSALLWFTDFSSVLHDLVYAISLQNLKKSAKQPSLKSHNWNFSSETLTVFSLSSLCLRQWRQENERNALLSIKAECEEVCWG